ncbi:hypothetical protein C0995_006160 [Termitomyces sp. Mi166|nr:hypothetical protein C0995_006160 [Termitomyces sp. Mi166\
MIHRRLTQYLLLPLGIRAINPPSVDAYNQYRAAAKAVTAAVPSTITLALTGQFASATAPPQLPATSASTLISSTSPVTSISTSTSTSSSITPPPTSIPTPNPTEEPTKSKRGAIIGGSVAGGVVLIAIVTYIIWMLLRCRRKPPERGSKDFFRYRGQTPTPPFPIEPTGNFKLSPFVSSPNDNAHRALLTSMTQSSPASIPSSFTPSPPVSAHPYSTATPTISGVNSSPTMRTRVSPSSSQSRPSPPPRPPLPPVPTTPPLAEQKHPPPVKTSSAEDGSHIRALAREVAVMLSQEQLNGGGNTNPRHSVDRGESPAPPGYRAATAV